MKNLKKAQDLVRNFKFDKDFMEEFIESGVYSIEDIVKAVTATVNASTSKENKDAPLGCSKTGGNPHFPKGVEWPKNHYFHAQYNLKELHEYDITNFFPDNGMLYLFFNPEFEYEGYPCTILYFKGDNLELEEREWPTKESGNEDFQYYYNRMKEDGEVIEFSASFDFNFMIFNELYEEIPKELFEALDELGIKNKDSGKIGYSLINERANVAQSEDYEPDFGAGTDGYMIFQAEFGEGSIHYWLKPDFLRGKLLMVDFVLILGLNRYK